MFSTIKLILFLIFINGVLSEKNHHHHSCDVGDSKCLTVSGNLIWKRLITGEPIVETSDPLHQDVIEANLPKLWFKLTNASLSGMINCHVELLKIMKKDLKYECHLRCPLLTLNSEYDIKGVLASVFLQGKGTCKVDFYDYNLFFTGDYERNIKNGKVHVLYKNNKIEFGLNEKAHYEFENLFNGDKEKSDTALKELNENSEMVDKPTRLFILKPFIDKYFENVNAYSNIVPVEEFFVM